MLRCRLWFAGSAMIVLGVVASAAAECAWVLWRVESAMEYPSTVPKTAHFLESAHPTYSECLRVANGVTAVLRDSYVDLGAKDLQYKPGVPFLGYRTESPDGTPKRAGTYNLQCFPDSIDLRGAKGSGR